MRPEDEGFNGAANFLADKMADNGLQATARTSQIFLGMAVQCTQCHNHPFNEYKQNQFWEMNAFFRQTKLERVATDEKKQKFVAKIVDQRFQRRGQQPEQGRDLLRAAEWQAEGGVPGVRGWHVAGGALSRTRAKTSATTAH